MNCRPIQTKRRLPFVFCFLLAAILTSPTIGQDVLRNIKSLNREVKKSLFVRKRPKSSQDTAIECLAKEIDWLECYLDRYGSVVAKQPDIWGESRLTKFRRQVEEQLAARLDDFQLRDNATIVRSDIAELAAALSLGAAAGGQSLASPRATDFGQGLGVAVDTVQPPPSADGTEPPPVTTVTHNVQFRELQPIGGLPRATAGSNLEPVIELNQLNRYLSHLNQLRRINEGDDTSDAPGYALNLIRIPVSIMPGRDTRRGYGAEITVTAEPHISESLLPTTFRNLVVNDLVDQLSLPVLRFAENKNLALGLFFDRNRDVTDRLRQEIQRLAEMPRNQLNEATMRQFLSFTFQQNDNTSNIDSLDHYAAELRAVLGSIDQATLANEVESAVVSIKTVFVVDGLSQVARSQDVDAHKSISWPRFTARQGQIAATKLRQSLVDRSPTMEVQIDSAIPNEITQTYGGLDLAGQGIEFAASDFADVAEDLASDAISELVKSLTSMSAKISELADISGMPTGRNRRSRFPLPQVLVSDIIGYRTHNTMANELKSGYHGRYVAWNETADYAGQIHLMDARQFLQANFDAAYDAVAQPEARTILINTIDGHFSKNGRPLADLIHQGDVRQIDHVREAFLYCMTGQGRPEFAHQYQSYSAPIQIDARGHSNEYPEATLSTDPVLAQFCWCVVVEMAVLNKQLNDDIHQVALTRECECHPTQEYAYYLPMPHDHLAWQNDTDLREASFQFREYVRCRWPIHVFTIDPVHQEQNISEASAIRRELAIAAAISFVSGRISLSQMTRFQRQYQEEITTVGLNRTQTGFVHGSDTFGWRFSPRVQTHKPQGTLRALAETTFGRRIDANLREAELEPGMRECTAIVLMPSFVPYCDFHIRSNWYKLNRPKQTEFSMHATMKLSRSIQSMKRCREQCVQCESLYRDGEVKRLLCRVEQLERELPLQSLRAQIPYENTLGGFELFNNGLTDLAPELVGWYGAPGIVVKPAAAATLTISPSNPAAGAAGTSATATNTSTTTTSIVVNAVPATATATTPSPPPPTPPNPTNSGEFTTLFLVGDNFSVHETKVIAGGVEIPNFELISRQIMRVQIPPSVQTVEINDRKFVAIYAATPYGVTGHMHIPVAETETGKAAKSLAVLEQKLLGEINKTGFAFEFTDPLDIGFSYSPCDKDNCSFLTCPEAIHASSKLRLTSKRLADHYGKLSKRFCLIGVLKNAKQQPLGGAFEIFVGSLINNELVLAHQQMLTQAFVEHLKRHITKSVYGEQEIIQLTLETYIVFIEEDDDDNQPIGQPIKTEFVIPVNLLKRASCRPADPAPPGSAAMPAAASRSANLNAPNTPQPPSVVPQFNGPSYRPVSNR